MRYRHCIFDLYGTLVDIRTDEQNPALWTAMAAFYTEAGAAYAPDALKAAYFGAVRTLERGMGVLDGGGHEAHPEIRLEQVFRQLYQAKGVDAGDELVVRTGRRFREASTEYIRLYPGALELLAALRKHGCGVWLLSNAQALFTRPELHALGLEACFDAIYLSSDYGIKKPDRRFFRLLLRERGIDPRTAVMVGNDGACDIEGARLEGLATLYIRSNLSPWEPTPQADFVLEEMDLTKVRDLLTRV